MRELLYLSTKKLGTFLPDWPSLSVRGTGSAGVGPVSVTVDVSAASPAGFDEATVKAFRQVRGHLEREAGYFTSPDLEAGQWIFFDVKMGYGTVYRDSGLLPPEDDVALFYGSYRAAEPDGQVSTDLLLCGSTEHLRRRTASAGRMGSGTEWLHDLIGKVNDADRDGDGGLPDEVRPGALAAKRTNMPAQIARWVFDVIQDHHSPDQYARLQGLAKILFIVPENGIVDRLVLATPLDPIEVDMLRAHRHGARILSPREASRACVAVGPPLQLVPHQATGRAAVPPWAEVIGNPASPRFGRSD